MTPVDKLHHTFEADFFRCNRCGVVFTLVEQVAFINSNQRGPCPSCFSNRYHQLNPEDLAWWEWFLPRVWLFSLLRWAGRI